MILVVLQNAWRRKAKAGDREFVPGMPRDRSDKVWRIALERSRSGQRLKQMLPEGAEWTAINASPFVGNESRAHFPYDSEHVGSELIRLGIMFPIFGEETFDTVLLCGVEAQKSSGIFAELEITVIKTFHPAYRLLTTEMCAEVRREIEQ